MTRITQKYQEMEKKAVRCTVLLSHTLAHPETRSEIKKLLIAVRYGLLPLPAMATLINADGLYSTQQLDLHGMGFKLYVVDGLVCGRRTCMNRIAGAAKGKEIEENQGLERNRETVSYSMQINGNHWNRKATKQCDYTGNRIKPNTCL